MSHNNDFSNDNNPDDVVRLIPSSSSSSSLLIMKQQQPSVAPPGTEQQEQQEQQTRQQPYPRRTLFPNFFNQSTLSHHGKNNKSNIQKISSLSFRLKVLGLLCFSIFIISFIISMKIPKLTIIVTDVTIELNNQYHYHHHLSSSESDHHYHNNDNVVKYNDNNNANNDKKHNDLYNIVNNTNYIAWQSHDNNKHVPNRIRSIETIHNYNNDNNKCSKEEHRILTYNPINNNRTLLILVSSSRPRNRKENQIIYQSIMNHMIHPNEANGHEVDVGVLYFYSDNDIQPPKILYIHKSLKQNFNHHLKYIWPINITKYDKDWGYAIDDIIIQQQQESIYTEKTANNSSNNTTRSNNNRNTNTNWRNLLKLMVQKYNDDTNIFGGVENCHYFIKKKRPITKCLGNGMSELILYHYIQHYILHSTTNDSIFSKVQLNNNNSTSSDHDNKYLIDYYDRYMITHIDIYYQCHHHNYTTLSSLNPNYIYTPSAVNNIQNMYNNNHADSFGIPKTLWILSYQHIINGVLNIIPNLLYNYQNYYLYENLSLMNVQRLIRTVWRYQCLLLYHRRIYRNMISTVINNTSITTPASSSRSTILIDGIQMKERYPGEYTLSNQFCNAAVASSNNAIGDMLPNPNEGTALSLATSAITNTSYIYPTVCHVNIDNETLEINQPLPLLYNDENDIDEDQNKNTKHNKTLVIIMGSLRGSEIAWETLYRNVLDYNNADLALCIGDTRDTYHNASLFARAKYYWKFSEYKDWSIPLDEMYQRVVVNNNSTSSSESLVSDNWRNTILPYVVKREGLFGGIKGYKGSGAIIMIIRYFLQQKIIEFDLIHQYTTFIITRSDHYYLCYENLSSLYYMNRYLYTPNGGSDFQGVTDRHLIVSNRYVLQALDIFPTLLRNPKPFIALSFYNMNPERLIRYAWKFQTNQDFTSYLDTNITSNITSVSALHNNNKIFHNDIGSSSSSNGDGCLLKRHKQYDRVMFTCGVAGDTTRWQPLSKQVKEGVYLKYTNEYYAAHMTCRRRRQQELDQKALQT